METMEQTDVTSPAATMEDLTICFQITFRMPSNRKKGDMQYVDTMGTDESMLSVSKQIWDSDEFRKIRRHAAFMKAYVRSKALPSPWLKSAIFSLPLPLVETVQTKVDEMTAEFYELVDEFVAAYEGTRDGESVIDKAKRLLGPQFNEADYPPADKLRESFGVDTRFLETRTPTKLTEISPTLYEAERRRAAERWKVIEQSAETLLFAEMKELVDKMVDQLGFSEDGKKKAFHKKNAQKLAEYLENLPFRNVMQNADLDKLCQSASMLLQGLDVQALRKQDDYRDAVRESFEAMKAKLDAIVVDAPTRAIALDDE